MRRATNRGASISQNRAVGLGLLLTLPCVAAFLIIPDLIMRALFAHGAFHVEAAHASAMALVAYGVGLPAFVLVRCVTPTFYARHDTATPVRATLISVAANIAMKIALVWGLGFGVVGIALGTSLAAWINLGLLGLMARRRKLLVMTTELSARAAFHCRRGRRRRGGIFHRFANLAEPLAGALPRDDAFAIAALAGGAAYAGRRRRAAAQSAAELRRAMIRLFVALEFPKGVRARLALLAAACPARAGSAAIRCI